MAGTAKKSDPKLWDKVKTKVTKGSKGGDAGEWSARKAQLAVQEYKREGGGYVGAKSEDNHLHQWTEEDWGTKSGEKSGETGERYLPKEAREHLTKEEYDRTTAKKRRDSAKGKQFSDQPKDVAKKTAAYRHDGKGEPTKSDLYAEAKKRNIEGRSKMSKAELERALERAS
ncbi:hypothetical protein [Mangrovicella endophytica]|uniref:hypothetical protein n=1 Tax=Mangrovicella endophytica TaxID=2066697 RepID=UPI000C9E27B7|nr:hypothetical protein [Mangrovicella endophytica]